MRIMKMFFGFLDLSVMLLIVVSLHVSYQASVVSDPTTECPFMRIYESLHETATIGVSHVENAQNG